MSRRGAGESTWYNGSMFVYVLILCMTLVPFLELVILLEFHAGLSILVGGWKALFLTVFSVTMTGVVGAMLARHQGLSTIRKVQESLARGELPKNELMDGVMILVGAVLLMTPGFLSDIVGLSLLIPLSRAAYRHLISHWLQKQMITGRGHFKVTIAGMGFDPFPRQDPDVVETTWRKVEPEKVEGSQAKPEDPETR